MEFKGRYTLPAAPKAVWAALNDPQVLGACLPGCEGVEKISEREFRATANVKVGGVKARLAGRVTMSEPEPPRGCKLVAEGQGVAGFMKGSAKVRLVPSHEATILSYDAKASASGRLAQVGSRAFDAAAKSFADDFFAKLAAFLDRETHPPVHDQTSMVPESHTAHDSQRAAHTANGIAPQIWVAGLVAVVVIVLILFGMVL
jgi:uncharacterized protein